MKKEDAVYAMTKTEIKCFAVTQGSYSTEIVNPFQGSVPSQLVCGIVDSRALHGDYGKDSLKFEHCNLRSIKCVVDGADLGQSPIYTKYKDTVVDSDFTVAYNSLRGFGGVSNVVPFGLRDYYDGKTLYRFISEDEDVSNIGGGQGTGSVLPLKRSGNVKLNLQFDTPLDSPKTVMLFGEFPWQFKISSNRDVLVTSV